MVPAKKRFAAGDIVCDRNRPGVPLYVAARDARGRLTVVNAAGEESTIGAQFVDDYIAKVCATERQLMAQRSALAALLKAASPDDCSVHARAHAALAPSPAPPPKAGPRRRGSFASEFLAPPPPPQPPRRARKAAKASKATTDAARAVRIAVDVLGIHDTRGKVGKVESEQLPLPKHAATHKPSQR